MYAPIANVVWDYLHEKFNRISGAKWDIYPGKKSNTTHESISFSNQAYVMIVSDESHKVVATNAGPLGANPGANLT